MSRHTTQRSLGFRLTFVEADVRSREYASERRYAQALRPIADRGFVRPCALGESPA